MGMDYLVVLIGTDVMCYDALTVQAGTPMAVNEDDGVCRKGLHPVFVIPWRCDRPIPVKLSYSLGG